ncbi:VOC family protein [Elstera cyanobacteriorum]|uniref:VOC domain-containing protein n=1 Tax=Elstera cyanobacteriorum TaxID=2022747 RepID=A0A255XIB0_9PROT|nr:hypothetical protein [Elstera cyanobacteriorum]MCK6442848.1 hypothetical protein [Elstera cyanobacteriorum]OYQ16723.1 hypothetical protein CHR90_17200 [Elstera cyanobacteriorum]GFZ88100.1 hypothetical protein GCM10011497_16460 [Elstera cyanobacteriorum]
MTDPTLETCARPAFAAGRNIALKMPPHEYHHAIAFYRDILGLEQLSADDTSVTFRFGEMRLWVDRVPTLSQAETWLEIRTDDAEAAADWLEAQGIDRCDTIEPLPDGFPGYWILAPGGIVHLIHERRAVTTD